MAALPGSLKNLDGVLGPGANNARRAHQSSAACDEAVQDAFAVEPQQRQLNSTQSTAHQTHTSIVSMKKSNNN